MSTFEFDDRIGGRLRGTLHVPGATPGDVVTVGANGALSPVPGGGSQPAYEGIVGTNVSIADNAIEDLDWGASIGPDTLLDLTDPTLPTVLTGGLYLVQVYVVPVGGVLTAGGQFAAFLTLDQAGAAQNVATLTPATTANGTSQVFLPFTWFVPAGGILECAVQNLDGTSSRDFSLEAFIVKLG